MNTTVTKRQLAKRELIVEEMIAKEVVAFDRRTEEIIHEMFTDIQARKSTTVKHPSLPSKPAGRKSA